MDTCLEGERGKHNLTTFEQKNRHLPQIKINKVLGLVCDVAAEISSNNTVPSGVVFLVKFLLNIGSDILRKIKVV